jgi:hypothetical protein
MEVFTATIKRFNEKGEKTGWTYIDISAAIAGKIKPGDKKGFRVKGKLDDYAFEGLSLLPMGKGNFILTLNAIIRKAIKKQKGASVHVIMEADSSSYQINADFLQCLADDPQATAIFSRLPNSHKNYYSKWIDSAKTEATRAKRIAMVLRGLDDGLDFGGMLRRAREEKQILGK